MENLKTQKMWLSDTISVLSGSVFHAVLDVAQVSSINYFIFSLM